MINEKQHPGAQGFMGGIVPAKCGSAAGLEGDVTKAGGCTMLRERQLRDLENALAVTLRIGADLSRRGSKV